MTRHLYSKLEELATLAIEERELRLNLDISRQLLRSLLFSRLQYEVNSLDLLYELIRLCEDEAQGWCRG